MNAPTHFDQLYPGRFLKAGDVSEKPTLTIRTIEMEDLVTEKGPKTSAIVLFREDKRGLVLNKTNGYLLRAMFGADLSVWIGKRVVLHRDDAVQFGREVVSAVRVFGSPDIAADVTTEYKHPKKKAVQVVLRATGAGMTRDPAKARTLSNEQREHVTDLRGRMAGIIRGDQEEDASAIKRATEMLGPVKVGTYDADVARMLGLIVQAQLTAGGANP